MAEDQHLLWTTKGSQIAVKDQDYLDPYSMYDFFNAANATRVHQRRLGMRARSAAPRLGTRQSIDTDSEGNSFQMHTYLRNPSPTPATSPPLSARSGQSRFNSATSSKHVVSAKQSSPTSLYLGFHKTRCKSAPPRPVGYYLPKRPKTAKSQPRLPVSSFGNGPKRAWRNRTRSAKDCHSLLSPEEVNQRHKERCKSAPLPYDFSSIEHVTSVHGHSSDIQKLKALTRPLTCMPEVVQSVLSSNNLRHCCSAYHLRPKTSTNMKQQFWPVTRPAVFQRGNVAEYLHFVKPAGLWIHGAGHIHHTSGSGDNASGTDEPNVYDMSTGTNLSIHGSDEMDDTFLHQEQFLVSAAPSVESLSDQENWPELEVDGDVPAAEAVHSEDLNNEFLHVEEDADKPPDEQETQTLPVEEREWDVKISQPHDQGLKITVTEVESLLVVQEPNKEHQEQRRPKDEEPTAQDIGLEIEVSTIPLEEKGTESGIETARDLKTEAPLKHDLGAEQSPVPVLGEPSEPANEPVDGDAEQHAVETSGQGSVVSKTPQVKFSEVLILTSFKAPGVKEEAKTLPRKPILNTTPAKKQAALPPVLEKPKLPQMEHQEKTGTTFLKPKAQLMTTTEKPVAHKEEQKQEQEEKEAEAKEDKPLKLEAAVLPQPEYIHAPGAYRMYEPKDLLQYQMEQHRESKSKKKSLTASMITFVPSAESSAVMTSILDDQKRMKEGMKPWLQGRLALSRQTSRFELPMDVRLLEDMTPMEYLTKYCIISTRRKALYKHIFQKVDRDRDNFITFKEMDKGLKDVHVDYINTEQVKKLVEMVDGTEKSMFNLQQFSAIAAFSERLLLSESQANEKERVYSSKEIIEEADFCGLKAKLSGFAVNPTVRKILEVL